MLMGVHVQKKNRIFVSLVSFKSFTNVFRGKKLNISELNSSIFRASVCVRCCNFNAAKSFFNVINFVGILCFKQIRKLK